MANIQDGMNTGLQHHADSNEDRIRDLERDVNGRGGIFAMITALNEKVDKLSEIVETMCDDVRDMKGKLKAIAENDAEIKEDRKPLIGAAVYVIGVLFSDAIVGIVTWLLTRR